MTRTGTHALLSAADSCLLKNVFQPSWRRVTLDDFIGLAGFRHGTAGHAADGGG
jgi:hypothetical protein